MSSVYNVTRFLTDRDLGDLNRLYNALPEVKVKRYYNLFYLTKKEIHDLPPELSVVWERVKHKLEEKAGLESYSHYFLEYPEGSFTRAHTDNVDDVGRTAVSLISVSDDLEGGDAIGYLPHWKKEVEEFDLNRYSNDDHCNNGEPIIPVVIKQKVGETLWYGHDFKHAVGQVVKGKRRVLISWFRRKNEVHI